MMMENAESAESSDGALQFLPGYGRKYREKMALLHLDADCGGTIMVSFCA